MQAIADCGEVARPAATDHEPRQRAGEIGRRREPGANVGAQIDLAHKQPDGVEAPDDRGRVGERRREALRQHAGARDRDGAIDGGDQRAAALAALGAHQLKVRARRRIDRERRSRSFAGRRRQRRPLAELGALHIGDAGRRGGQLQARERAKRFRRCDRKIRRQPPLGGCAVEHVAGERRHRRQ
jgi:hypothetical protein